MSDAIVIFPFGMLLGALYFGGLWWTVKKAVGAKSPARWFIVSLLLRLGLALSGFYFVAGGDWKKLLACLLGFVAARVLVIWLTNGHDSYSTPDNETCYARFPHLNPLPEGEEANERLREFQVNMPKEADHAP